MDVQEIRKLDAYLKRLFGNPRIRVVPKKSDSADVFVGEEIQMGRKLVIELTSGTYEYQGVPSEVWRRFSDASSPWSYYRDNIEEEYTAKRLR